MNVADTKPYVRSGIVIVDKPRGPTSHDVVAAVRRTLATSQVGHAGTLDPMATGVLVVAVGEATKLVPWLTDHTKSYQATVALGVETDTLDAEGTELRREPPGEELMAFLRGHAPRGDAPAFVAAALTAERERKAQVPPAFSAIKKDGERAYAMARRGERPALAERAVSVFRLELLDWGSDPPQLHVAVDVAKGYYVRALARDLANALGTAGHLTALRRTRSGTFSCEDALPWNAPRTEMIAGMVGLARAAAAALPLAELTDPGVRDARHGRRVNAGDIASRADANAGPSAWLDGKGHLVAVGSVGDDGCGTVLRGFSDPR
jgi:tRNA pseudouridine55 synthase